LTIPIHWFEAFNSGFEEIDESHKRVINEFNKLIETYQLKDVSQLDGFFQKVIYLAENHFAEEEIILEKHNFPDLKNHSVEHKETIQELEKFKSNLKNIAANEFVNFSLIYVRDYWVHHMFSEVIEFQRFNQTN
jgi:hemerythrin